MKTFSLITVLLLFTVSCDDNAINDMKVKAAESVEKLVKTQLTTAYEDVEIADYSCADEVDIIGDNVYTKVTTFLKVKEVDKSLVGSTLLIPLCEYVGGQILPQLIEGSATDNYRCLRFIGADGVRKISENLCKFITL